MGKIVWQKREIGKDRWEREQERGGEDREKVSDKEDRFKYRVHGGIIHVMLCLHQGHCKSYEAKGIGESSR